MLHMEGKNVIYLKGAPDVLLSKCKFYFDSSGNKVPIDVITL